MQKLEEEGDALSLVSSLSLSTMPARIEVPLLPVTHVSRPRLMKRMRNLFAQKLTRVVAPMGYGKTCALSEYALEVREQGGKCFWLSLDSAEDEAEPFWSHVLYAFGKRDSAAAATWYEAVNASNEIAESMASAPLLVVFDNFEVIANEELQGEIVQFASSVSQSFHMVVCARSLEGAFQQRLAIFGQEALSHYDLAFADEEVDTLASSHAAFCDLDYSDADIAKVKSQAEGWPQGVYLGLKVLAGSIQQGVRFRFNGSCDAVASYFSAQMSGNVTPECRKLFVLVSVFERFNEPMVSYALEGQPCPFDEMTESGFPIFACDERRAWYKLDSLFADWLRVQLADLPLADTRDMCLRASAWMHDRRLFNEAAKYMIMASDYEYIEHVVQAACGLRRPKRRLSPLRWLCEVPAATFEDSPLMSILCAWAYNSAGYIEDAREWAALFASCARSSKGAGLDRETVERSIKLLDMKHDAMEGECMRALEVCDELLSLGVLDAAVQCVIYQSQGEALERMGEMRRAGDAYLKAQASANVDKTGHQLYFNKLHFAELCYRMGELDTAMEYCQRVIDAGQSNSSFDGGAYVLMALLYVEKNDSEQARLCIDEAKLRVTEYRNIDLYLDFIMTEAGVLVLEGDLYRAYETVSAATLLGERRKVPRGALARAYFRQGEIAGRLGSMSDMEDTAHRMETCLSVDDAYFRLLLEYLKGTMQLEMGRHEAAEAKLDYVLSRALECKAMVLACKALVAEVALFQEMRNVARLYNVTREVIELSARCGFVRTLLEGGEPMRMALRDYLSMRDVGPDMRAHIKRLLSEFDSTAKETRRRGLNGGAQDIARIELLTEREREVLDLMNTGMSRREISDELCISINTTKRHIANIYDKLGVTSKKHALEAAFSLAKKGHSS